MTPGTIPNMTPRAIPKRDHSPGITRLFAIMQESIDGDRSSPRKTAPANSASRPARPTAFPDMVLKMTEHTRNTVEEHITRITRNIFKITPQQVHTLLALGLPDHVNASILSSNYLLKITPHHRINDRLDIIQSIPPSTSNQPPDWQQWSLERIHSPTTPFCQAAEDSQAHPILHPLDQAVLAIGKTACRNFPQLKQVMNKKNPREKKNKTPPTLVDAWIKVNQLLTTGKTLLLPPEDLRPVTFNTPEQLAGDCVGTYPNSCSISNQQSKDMP